MGTIRRAIALTLASISAAASANTTLPLNSGYNHAVFSPYAVPNLPATASDNYWTEVSGPAAPLPQAAFVVKPHPAWAGAMADSTWISPTATNASVPGTSGTNPAFFVFRKCFCLMPNYKNPKLSYSIRGDENTMVYLNPAMQMNVLSGPSPANFTAASPIVTGATSNPALFRQGLNCIYVLLMDTGGSVGFNLSGSVTATGLMPVAGTGTGPNPSFAPCQCTSGTKGAKAEVADDRAVVQAIVREARQRFRQSPAQ